MEIKMQKRFGFVVLNYKNYAETIACVASILCIASDNYFVVVVDNDSPNESFQVLSDRYAGHAKIKVLQSGSNGGYSFGNNYGIKYLQSIGINDVIIATSDTLVVSRDILEQIAHFDSPDIGVIGPKVANLNGDMQNPMLARVDASYIINIHFPPVASLARTLVHTWRNLRGKPLQTQRAASLTDQTVRSVYMVHGCFLYLSSNYLARCGYLDDSLFMYGEEDLLAFNCYANGLRTLYVPQVSVVHKEAQSTPQDKSNTFFKTNSKKSIAYLKKKMKLSILLSQSIGSRGMQ